MRKGLAFFGLAIVVVLVGMALLTISLYQATQQAPTFYEAALARSGGEQARVRDEFLARATALASDLHHPGTWQSVFTADQINAWLALDLASTLPNLLLADLSQPRVSIGDDQATIACRYQVDGVTTVLSLTIDTYLQEPNVVAVRICRARAGALPVPLARVLGAISQAARALHIRLEWRKTQGDPVALITFPRKRDSESNKLELRTISLRAGELFVAGRIGEDPSDRHPSGIAGTDLPTPGGDKPIDDQPLLGSAQKETRQK